MEKQQQKRIEPGDEAKAKALRAIAEAHEKWATLTPEQRIEHLRKTQLEAEERAAQAELVTDEKIKGVMENFMALFQNAKLMTPEQERDWFWRKKIVPQMKSCGWPDAHIKRMGLRDCQPQREALRLTRGLLRGKGAIVALVGSRGVGKTTITAQIALDFCEDNLRWWDADPAARLDEEPPETPRYYKLGQLANKFKLLYVDHGGIGQEILRENLRDLVRYPTVVLDEIHESQDLKVQMRFLVDFLDQRYALGRNTIIISNHEPEEFSSEVNPSIISRIHEHGAIIPCLWESHRAK